MFQKTAVFAFLPFLQINDHDQLVLWSILNFFDKSGYKWACQFWWCICSELFVNSKVAHPDGSVILINDNIISSISPPPFSSSTLWHPRLWTLAWQLPYNSSYDHRHHHVLTIWISAIIFITTAPTYVTISAAPRCSRRLLWSQKVLSTLRCEESTVCHPGGSLNSRVMVTRPHLSFPFVGQRI